MAVTLTGIRGVVFDLDDTLYPEQDYALSGLRAAGEWLETQIPCPADPKARLIEMFQEGRRGRLFNELLDEWGCLTAGELVPRLVACYREHVPELRLHADARRALNRWSGRFRLGLITDGTLIAQERKIEALRLTELLDPIICTDQWGAPFWKPHPRAFQEIEKAWELTGPECVYLADNPAKDFVAPNRLGWHSVQVQRSGGEYTGVSAPTGGEPEARAASMDEVELRL